MVSRQTLGQKRGWCTFLVKGQDKRYFSFCELYGLCYCSIKVIKDNKGMSMSMSKIGHRPDLTCGPYLPTLLSNGV